MLAYHGDEFVLRLLTFWDFVDTFIRNVSSLFDKKKELIREDALAVAN